MPQLNPAPWFLILFFSWLIFLIVLPRKVLAHTFPNEATSRSVHIPKTEAWVWPWY
nr:ATP synthase F0 subunit 8 [Xyrichtys splendens]